ncbi:unnamed protein product [Polarella glacialis]|uniref:peptidylprolyl isomerase n=1 Tax=Polarella glacialis TaxID=89957 RepID=A0A813DRF8_POLGL|nr:unnamed protein product [Polarella glacialis]
MAEIEVGFVDVSEDQDGGLLKKILVEGKGDATPPKGSSVEVHYVGTLEDGSKFDSSRDRPGNFKFDVGVGQVIKGWDQGICSMKIGEKCILRCSSDYAYGDRGSPPKIPGGATLNFEVELFAFKEKVKTARQMTVEERRAYALKMKDQGTEAFKQQDFATAINRYEDGAEYITFSAGGGHGGGHGHSHGGEPCSGGHGDESDEDDDDMGHGHGAAAVADDDLGDEDKALAVALLNNCAMAKLKAGDADSAKFDCTKVLKYDAKNVKAIFRRAQAELAMGNFSACAEDTARVIEIEPENKEAGALRRKALDDEKKAKQKEKAMYSKMFG